MQRVQGGLSLVQGGLGSLGSPTPSNGLQIGARLDPMTRVGGYALRWTSLGRVVETSTTASGEGTEMKISELIEDLQASLDDSGDREVMVAQQPSWPLAARVVQVYDPQYDDEQQVSDEDADVLWIATAEVTGTDRSPYAPRVAWSEQF